MNCDQVFEILTRGPFPTGDPTDADVEQHLGECLSCRKLADALRPALELFEEAVSPAESRDLPGYWSGRPNVPSLAAEVARAALLQTPVTEPSRARRPSTTWYRIISRSRRASTASLVASLLVGLTLGALLFGLSGTTFSPRGDGENGGQEGVAGLPSGTRFALIAARRLAQLNIPVSCQDSALGQDSAQPGPAASPSDFETLDRLGIVCCTQCHHPGGAPTTTSRAKVEMSMSCSVCHLN